MKWLALMLLLAIGCQQIVSVVEYPDYVRAREARKRLPPPAPIIDPTTRPVYTPVTQTKPIFLLRTATK